MVEAITLVFVLQHSIDNRSILQRLSSDKDRFGRGINEGSGTITLSTGLGDNINLNFMTGFSDDEEGQEVI